MQNAGLSGQERSAALAARLKFVDVAANMRRLFGSCGGAERQDVLITEEADEPSEEDRDREARAKYRKSKKQGAGQKRGDGTPKVSGGKLKGGGRTSNGFNRRTGPRNRRYKCDSEYHLAPTCPWRDVLRSELSPAPQGRGKARKPSFSTISMETPVSTSGAGLSEFDTTG